MAEVREFSSYANKRTAPGKKRRNRKNRAEEEYSEYRETDEPVHIGHRTAERTEPPVSEALYADNRSYKDKIRSHKIKIWTRRIIITALIASIVAAVYVSWRNRHYESQQITASARISGNEGVTSIRLMNNILQYSKDGVSLMNASGEALWNQTYEMQNPTVHICRDIAAIGDYNGHHIYIASTNGPLGRVDTNLPIRDFRVAAQGVVAAVLDDTDVTWICLYDPEGNLLANFKTTMKDSGYPAAIDISPSGELVCVSYVHPDGGDIKTSIAFFNFGAVGANATDNYASGYDYPGEVSPYVAFLGDGASFAVSDKRIMFYAGSEVPVSQTENFTGADEIRSVFHNEQYVGLVFSGGGTDSVTGTGKASDSDSTAYRLQVYNTTGNLIMTRGFDIDYSDIMFDNDPIVIYDENEFMITDMKGDEKYHGLFDHSVRTMIPTTLRNRFFLVTANSVETMELN